VVPGVAIVLLNSDGVLFANNMPISRKDFFESLPVVRVKNAGSQVLDFVIEPPEGFSITTTDNPGNSSPCATIHRFDDPFFVFFDWIKCHISSNSISLIEPEITGSSMPSAIDFIHLYAVLRDTPKSLPRNPNDDFPIA
jgi:hypothetical protein